MQGCWLTSQEWFDVDYTSSSGYAKGCFGIEDARADVCPKALVVQSFSQMPIFPKNFVHSNFQVVFCVMEFVHS